MRDFDRIDPRFIQRSSNLLDVIDAVLMTDGMHAIAQSHILNIELAGRAHAAISALRLRATRSAVRSAADVMISRFPA